MEVAASGKWIDFYLQPKPENSKKITNVYMIVNRDSNVMIGYIKWFGSFRQYSFFPEPNMVFERKCMKDIIEFLDKIMLEHKESKNR